MQILGNNSLIQDEQKYDDAISNVTHSKSTQSNSNSGLSDSSSSLYTFLQTRDATINGIALYKHAVIDIFSLFDCQWHNVKVTEIRKECKTIQYEGIFNEDIKGAIHYKRHWWKIAKYKSKDIDNNYNDDNNDKAINTLFAIKYRTKNVRRQNVVIFGYLEIKWSLNGHYVRKYFEIKKQRECIFCYNNQSKNGRIFILNLTKITKISINPNGLDHLSFSISESKVNSNGIMTRYFKCTSFDDFVDWISVLHYFHKYPPQKNEKYHQIIFDGIVEKRGIYNKLYKKRYFALKDEHLWYSSIEDKYHLHKHKKIDLIDVKKICIIDDVDKDYKFHIIQPQRTWELRVESKDERTKWIHFIEQQSNKLKQVFICYRGMTIVFSCLFFLHRIKLFWKALWRKKVK